MTGSYLSKPLCRHHACHLAPITNSLRSDCNRCSALRRTAAPLALLFYRKPRHQSTAVGGTAEKTGIKRNRDGPPAGWKPGRTKSLLNSEILSEVFSFIREQSPTFQSNQCVQPQCMKENTDPKQENTEKFEHYNFVLSGINNETS